MANPRKGTIVDDRYRLVSKIGSGGMADVWRAEDTELDRQVAIKILHSRFAQDKEFVERFRREAQSAAGLQHPHVVGVFDRGEFRGTYYIAMEYVDGPSLKDLVKGGMSPEDAIDFTRQILQAARFAHKKGIVHRDLKPQNVLIDPEGRAKVADFGIARAGSSEITQTGSVMGTAQYLSPEQAQGAEVTPGSDLYSIGVVLYEALTGRVPFEADSAVAVALKQVSETPRRPSAINPRVPPALDAVVMRALAKDPERRYANADAFIRALDAARRNPERPRHQDTAAFVAVGLGGESTEVRRPADEDEEREEEERHPRRTGRWLLLALLVAAVAGLVAFALTRPERVEVPNVIGEDAGQATAILEAHGFDVDTKSVPSQARTDQVLEQDPPPTELTGEKADEGSTVTLTISSGPGTVRVPDVSGLSERDATEKLRTLGLLVGSEQRFSERVARGLVIGTEPAAGTEVAGGSDVILLISRGSNRVQVPSLIGMQEENAIATLDQLELSATVVTRDSEAPEGEVVNQSPGAGRRVKRGSTVTLFVSSGIITVPNVIGKFRSLAVSMLRKAGFRPVVREDPTALPGQAGRVTDQFPPGGSRSQRGDTVTIFVGAEPEPEPREETTTTVP